MATKIKRCLYVGLGGTGMNSLLYTKKSFIDTYGEVPPMIGFLGIDTDSGQYKKELTTNSGEPVLLTPKEQMPVCVKEARPIYEVNKDAFSWIPQENLFALGQMVRGAGAFRTNGRFAFTVNYANLSRKITEAINDISRIGISNNEKYELLGSDIEIHMVFSVCGGTGCGTFINMAYLLRKEAPNCKLTGYAILPGVFKSMSSTGMNNVYPNAYGAIADLDFLMHMGMGVEPFNLRYINEKDNYKIQDKPFNSVIFIDNQNEAGDVYTNIDQLSEMISLALVTSAGELSSATASVSDNLEKIIDAGDMDVENKRAWASGMGICEILYRNSALGDIYAIKAAKNLIERMLNSCTDADQIVNTWIDSSEVHIRENNGCDQVIDFMYEKTPKYDLTISNTRDARQEINDYLNSVKADDKILTAKIDELSERVKVELRKLIVEHINKECGISTAENIIKGILTQVEIFLGEMNSEKKEEEDLEIKYQTSLDTAIKDLAEYDGKFFKTRSKLDEKAEDAAQAARTLAIDRLEIARRTAAITFYNNLKKMLLDQYDLVKEVKESLLSVYNEFTQQLAAIQNQIGTEPKTFQIDLAQSFMNNVVIAAEDIQFSEFVKSIDEMDKIATFGKIDNNEVKKLLLSYTRKLNKAQEWYKTTIDDVINHMSDEEFERLIKRSIRKSMPLFRYDYHGYQPKEMPRDAYYIGLPDKTASRISKDDCFKNYVGGKVDVDYASIGGNSRIIIYRLIGVVPAYTLAGIPTYKSEYDAFTRFSHMDSALKRRMDDEEFSLTPKRSTDEDLLDLWVKGFLFGLLKNENGKYYMYSPTVGDALDDYWVELNTYRDDAYAKFRTYKNIVRKEFTEFIDNQETKQGADAMKALLADAKANYLTKYSQINMTKEQLRSKGYESIANLIRDELAHLKNEM